MKLTKKQKQALVFLLRRDHSFLGNTHDVLTADQIPHKLTYNALVRKGLAAKSEYGLNRHILTHNGYWLACKLHSQTISDNAK